MEEKKNVFIYVRGNKEHGKEVIEYLKSLGGKVKDVRYDGTHINSYYYIDATGGITAVNCYCNWITQYYTEVELHFKYQPKDKELVWCWDDDSESRRFLGFYDAINKRAFDGICGRNGWNFHNYAKYEGDYPDWAKEAQAKLED